MDALLEPFSFPFFRGGIAVATIAGVLCGLVGTYVVLRGMSYIGHGLSHAIFGWAVASFVAGVNFYIGAGLGGVVSALLINRIARRRAIGADAAIGVVTLAVFAVGVLLLSATGGFTRNFEAALFGSVLGVTGADVAVVAGVGAFVCASVFFLYRPLLFTTFDPEVAEASGVKTGWIDAAFAVLLAVTIVAGMRVLGVILIAAALVIPPVVARMLTDSFPRMLGLAVVIGGVSGFVGMYGSWFLGVASGPAIVLAQAALFVVVYAITGARKLRRLPPAPAGTSAA